MHRTADISPCADTMPAVCPGAARQCTDPLHCHAHGCLLSRHDDDEDDATDGACPACDGDGRDKWNDYILPCSSCGGTGR